jgi:hypothetical protein
MHTSAARALALCTSGVTYPGSIKHVRAVRADLHALLRGCPRAEDVILCRSPGTPHRALASGRRGRQVQIPGHPDRTTPTQVTGHL